MKALSLALITALSAGCSLPNAYMIKDPPCTVYGHVEEDKNIVEFICQDGDKPFLYGKIISDQDNNPTYMEYLLAPLNEPSLRIFCTPPDDLCKGLFDVYKRLLEANK